MTSRAK